MNTLFVGQHHIHLDRIDSTNHFAEVQLQSKNAFEGTLVTASEQYKGKGQRGNTWLSETGKNLIASIILKPSFLPAQAQFQLNKMASLAVLDFVSHKISAEISVKWPNDIFINDKKAAGILIQNFLRQDKIGHSIIGLGININQSDFQGLENAASLKNFSGFDYDLKSCAEEICEFLEARYFQLKAGSKKIDKDYLSYLYQMEEWKEYKIGNRLVTAKIKGISDFGKLIIEKENREIMECDLKEISFTR